MEIKDLTPILAEVISNTPFSSGSIILVEEDLLNIHIRKLDKFYLVSDKTARKSMNLPSIDKGQMLIISKALKTDFLTFQN